MSWSYAASTQALDQVRFRIGDTNSTAQLVSDEDIRLALTLASNNVLSAAVSVAESQAALATREGSMVKVGDFSINRGSQTEAGWLAIANNLRAQQARSAGVFVGGQGVTDKQTRTDDTTITKPSFTRDLFTQAQASTST